MKRSVGILVMFFVFLGGAAHASRDQGGSAIDFWLQEKGGYSGPSLFSTSGSYSKYGGISYVEAGGMYSRGGVSLTKSKTQCPGSAAFQWNYADGRCYEMGANTEFLSLIDQNFNKCVATGARAAGISSNQGSFQGRVTHVGFGGDARHQRTRSLHNVGRAVDISSIEVNGRVLDYKNASLNPNGTEAQFFAAFRQCWSQAVVAADASCASYATSSGLVGCLDHSGSHMHLSYPVCSGGANLNIAAFQYRMNSLLKFAFFMNSLRAQAASPGKTTKFNLTLASGAKVTGEAEFTGEPVNAPVQVKLQAVCAKGDGKPVVIEAGKAVCDDVSVKEDKAAKKLVLTYKEATIVDGSVECGSKELKQLYADPCAKK
ncbi:MAG: hypothetical protein KF802_12355 [Bdellovibrionaceae bacterium]|nr:hypothetical protein [Pseudobdellovibrionaceae bacterium]MBX3034658.1 hypothetical protein [Pseudobdellovibrionaceae bacterium]